MIIETWGELVTRLDQALTFAATLGLDVGTSRFASCRTRLAVLEETRVARGDQAAFDQFRSDSELNSVAFVESHELVEVVTFLQSIGRDIAKKKLQVVLKGSVSGASTTPPAEAAFCPKCGG